MSSLPEESNWEPNIYQLETETPVLAGPGGPDNIQAQQLANRTLFLKNQQLYLENQLESYNGLIKSGELPFTDKPAAQEYIDAGKIPEGSIFSIRSDNPDYWVDEYKNQGGVPVATGKHLLSEASITARINTDENGNIAFHKDEDGLNLLGKVRTSP